MPHSAFSAEQRTWAAPSRRSSTKKQYPDAKRTWAAPIYLKNTGAALSDYAQGEIVAPHPAHQPLASVAALAAVSVPAPQHDHRQRDSLSLSLSLSPLIVQRDLGFNFRVTDLGFNFRVTDLGFNFRVADLGLLIWVMASKRILKELKDLQKDPPTSCNAAVGTDFCHFEG